MPDIDLTIHLAAPSKLGEDHAIYFIGSMLLHAIFKTRLACLGITRHKLSGGCLSERSRQMPTILSLCEIIIFTRYTPFTLQKSILVMVNA